LDQLQADFLVGRNIVSLATISALEADMSDQGWQAFLAAEDVADWVVLHGGAMAVFGVSSLVEAVRLAEAVAHVPGLDGAGALMTITDEQLTVRLTRDIWQLEQRHVHLARAVSAVARAHGAVVDRGRAQEVQLAIAAQPDSANVGFWRAVLGYAGVSDDNAVDPLGHGSTVWMQDLDPAKPLRHAMHVEYLFLASRWSSALLPRSPQAAGSSTIPTLLRLGRSPTAPATAYASARGPMVLPALQARHQNPRLQRRSPD
jgi:4a-hydroxytetrahydrobiopterin dehydratase